MANEVYETPQVSIEIKSENKQVQRHWIPRFLFSALWFVPVSVLVITIAGATVGIASYSGATTFSEGYVQGNQAGKAFGAQYRIYIIASDIFIWGALCFFGKLPGTSKFKKAKS